MKISLIIPAYNEEAYLGATLEHAIKNSKGKFSEIIVVDNGSSDRTRAVALSFPSVRVVDETRKGPTMARQRGFQEGQGEILAYLDADTRMPPGWLDTVIEEFSKNEKLASLSGPYVYYDLSNLNQFLVKTFWYLMAMPMYFLIGRMIVAGNFAIRRSVLEKLNGFDTSIVFYGDEASLARRASKYGKIKFTPKLTMYTSGRRLKGEGFFKMGIIYIGNFLSEAFVKKIITKEYKDIR